jgi:hypothetical protein
MAYQPPHPARPSGRLSRSLLWVAMILPLHLGGCSFIYLNPPGGGDGCTVSPQGAWLDLGLTGGLALVTSPALQSPALPLGSPLPEIA